MPSPRDIKAHIQSVDNISKITKAMEVVATAKVHRLDTRVKATRDFAERSWEVLNHLASAAQDQLSENPMFCGYSDLNHLGLVLFTSSRGMVGAYDQSVISTAWRHLRSVGASAEIITVGKIGREYMLRQGQHIHADFSSLDDHADITEMAPLGRVILDGYETQHFDQVVLCYTQYQSGSRLQPIIRPLLPICPDENRDLHEYIYEPDPRTLLVALLPRIIRFQIYTAFLEAQASENAARMVAMHSATKNANELNESLKLSYNKARQEAITLELMDILGGSLQLGDKRS